MKYLAPLCTACLIIGGAARAQTGSSLVLGNPAAAPAGQTCVQVTVTGQTPSPYNCLNQQLQQQVRAAAPAPAAPLAANSAANAVGSFNRAGVAEQYGQNFGTSVTPYRPPAPDFAGGLHSP